MIGYRSQQHRKDLFPKMNRSVPSLLETIIPLHS